MLVTTLTFIVLLLFGGNVETEYLNHIESGVKTYVLDKKRKKEILSEITFSRKELRAYAKKRKKSFKEFQDLLVSEKIKKEDLDKFIQKVLQKRENFQLKFNRSRLKILNNINDTEWDKIVRQELKSKKKKQKSRKGYVKTRDAISKLTDEGAQKQILEKLDLFEKSFQSLETNINSELTNKESLIWNKSATEEQLLELGKQIHEKRLVTINSVIDFRESVFNNVNSKQFKNILKKFNKEFGLPSK